MAGHSLAGRGYQGGRQRSTGPWQEGELVSGTIVYGGHTEGGSTNEGGWEEPDRREHQVWEQLAVRGADGNVGCSICV